MNLKKTPLPDAQAGVEQFALESLTQLQLFTLREHINSLLPPGSLRDLNLEEELVLQFRMARAFQAMVLDSEDEPQKKAAVMNSCAATIQALVKMQSEFYTAERLKEIESKLIKALERVPAETLRDFFDWYEQTSWGNQK